MCSLECSAGIVPGRWLWVMLLLFFSCCLFVYIDLPIDYVLWAVWSAWQAFYPAGGGGSCCCCCLFHTYQLFLCSLDWHCTRQVVVDIFIVAFLLLLLFLFLFVYFYLFIICSLDCLAGIVPGRWCRSPDLTGAAFSAVSTVGRCARTQGQCAPSQHRQQGAQDGG